MNPKQALYLIDAYGLIYRSYFAFISRPLRNTEGKNVSAVFGFFRNLVTLIDQGAPTADGTIRKPVCLAAVFDSRVPTFRHERYPDYKANRQKTPEELHEQVPVVEEALAALGVPLLRADRYEADDLIATLAQRCKKEGRECYILSSDKDLLQLIGDGVYALKPGKSGAAVAGAIGANYEFVGAAEVKAEWGVDPSAIIDVLSLTGDASDNVPGVAGIGDKTATKLIARYGTLDGIYENIAGIEGAIGKKLAAGKEMAYFSHSLIELCLDAPIELDDLDSLSIAEIDREAGARALHKAGVRLIAQSLSESTVKELESNSGAPPTEGTLAAGTKESTASTAKPIQSSGSAQTNLFDDAPKTAYATAPRPVPTDALRTTGKYRTVLDINELEALFAKARKNKLFALDFETDGIDAWNVKPFGFSFALNYGEAVYVPVAPHGPGGSPHLDPEKTRALLSVLLADPAMTVVAHNAKYDYEVSRAWGIPRWNCRVWDTMVAAWIVDPERASYSLDTLVVSWLGLKTTPYDSIVPKGSVFSSVPLETATLYAAEDADYALRVKALLEPCLHEADAISLFRNVEMPLLPILAEMEGVGIRLESDKLRDYGVELTKNLELIEAEIYRLVGHPFNIASTKQLQDVLFVERKLKTGKKTKTGFSTDVGVLEELAREDPVPAQILRYRTLAKLKSTYVDTLQEQAGTDGRIHTHFVQTGTATGRISSKDPNLQNIPIRDEDGRRIRSAFVAEKGRTLISADYSQIELVVLAHLSGDEDLLSAFKDGVDVHRRTAALIFNMNENEVRADQRRIAKTINFGVMYGMSAFRLSNELNISRTEAQSFIDAYFRTYSGVQAYIRELIAKTEKLGYASTILGRRRYIPAIVSGNKTEKSAAERVAVNTPIQGSAADIVKLAMIRLDKALTASALDARLLLQVHDELILEASDAHSDEVMALAKREMESTVALRAPLRVGIEKGRSWGDIH
ncbi:MAG: DNA polymerase I [Treponemataceae bacterium]